GSRWSSTIRGTGWPTFSLKSKWQFPCKALHEGDRTIGRKVMLAASSPVPPLAYQDYPVALHLRIYQKGQRHGADVLAEGRWERVDVDLSPEDLASLNQQMQKAVQHLVLDT